MTIKLDVTPEIIQDIICDVQKDTSKSINFLFSVLATVYGDIDSIDNENEEFRQLLECWQEEQKDPEIDTNLITGE